MTARRMALVAIASVGLVGGASSCASDRESSPPEPGASTVTPAPPAPSVASAPPGTAATGGTATTATPPPVSAPSPPTDTDPAICNTIPSLESLSAAIGGPLSTATDYSSPVVVVAGETHIDQRCEAAGPDLYLVTFQRLDAANGQALLDEVAQQGLVQDLGWPALSGAVAWSNSVWIAQGGLVWGVGVITPETVGVADAPVAYELSAQVLADWLDG